MTGSIFNIQKFSIHDGPGVRTLIFFKGCPLACRWCSNPEGINARPEIAYTPKACLGAATCGLCIQHCKCGALSAEADGKIHTDRSRCTGCGECAKVCPSKSRILYGTPKTVQDILDVVEQDDVFYSGTGGITLSGGEPLLQPAFAAELLRTARKRGITTAIETTGCVPWESMEQVARETDYIHMDIKHPDSETHKTWTGVPNTKILENFNRLCREMPDKKILIRTPVIPGVNDNADTIRAIMRIIRDASPTAGYELLAFHQYGENKYATLDKTYPMKDAPALDKELFNFLQDMVHAEFKQTFPL